MIESENTSNPEDNETNHTAENAAETPPVPPSDPKAVDHKDKTRHAPKHPIDVWTFGFAVIAATATFVAACFTACQVQIAKDTEKRQLRAYVVVDEAAISSINSLDGSNPVLANLQIKNSGQTPASDISVRATMDYDTFPRTKAYSQVGINTFTSLSVAGPGGIIHSYPKSTGGPTQAQLDSMQNGTGAIYVFGYISYKDIFGASHTTNFRFFYGGVAGLRPDGALSQEDDGNGAD